jgi:hypothetical protein
MWPLNIYFAMKYEINIRIGNKYPEYNTQALVPVNFIFAPHLGHFLLMNIGLLIKVLKTKCPLWVVSSHIKCVI